MPRLSASRDARSNHEDVQSALAERRRQFAELRMRQCDAMQQLEIERVELLCEGCFSARVDGWTISYRNPDVRPETREIDLDRELEGELLDDDATFRCNECTTQLAADDSFYVERYEVLLDVREVVTVDPSKRQAGAIRRHYAYLCFECKRTCMAAELTMDHILPRQLGGTAAFSNLQPVCKSCRPGKANRPPTGTIVVAIVDQVRR